VIETKLSQPNVSNHLARLRELGLVVAQRDGRRVFYRIVSPDLVRALLLSPVSQELTEADRTAILDEVRPAFEQNVLLGDHQAVRSSVDRALGEGLPWQDLYTRVFAPVLVKVAGMRAAGEISVAQEHTINHFVERLMGHVGSLRVPLRKAGNCEVVIACVEGEFNGIAAQMAADFLAAEGYNVAFLGVDVPADGIVDSAIQLESKVVLVSAAGEDRLPAVKAVAAGLAKAALAGPAPVLLVGGSVSQAAPGFAAQPGVEEAPADLYALCTRVSAILG
jgi:methanogenic corrinoid protein MtbC1